MLPRTLAEPPNFRCQSAWLSTIPSSPRPNTRPSTGRSPSTPKKLEVTRPARNALCLAMAAQGHVHALKGREMLEEPRLLLHVQVVRIGRPFPGSSAKPVVLPNNHDTLRFRQRQRLEQNGAQDAEHRGIRSDAEREGQEHRRAEAALQRSVFSHRTASLARTSLPGLRHFRPGSVLRTLATLPKRRCAAARASAGESPALEVFFGLQIDV